MRRFASLAIVLVVALVVFPGCGEKQPDDAPSTAASSDANDSEDPTDSEDATDDADPASDSGPSSASADTPGDTESEEAGSNDSGDAAAAAAGTTLKLRFQYGGGVVEAPKVNITQDASFCGKHDLRDERLIVNPDNLGLKNVVVYVYTGRGGSKIETVPPRNQTVEIANKNCRFEPHIGVVQVGDTIRVTNPDSIGHNFNVGFFANDPVNVTIPSGEFKEITPENSEPAPIPVACNIHPWMTGYVIVFDHPYVGVSDENGDVTIPGLPEGPLVFRVFHEAGSIQEVKINEESVTWEKSRFQQEIKTGVNDMGTVTVPAFPQS